ncbi:hypothetical protein [Halococcus sediminicola]|uniref:hypothetical protein n=1 Tax=Halococcus sediminicola TaxID=1264579 RepID=UPI0006790ADC|nr:hypothetical protein [Halococcus sediminicola]
MAMAERLSLRQVLVGDGPTARRSLALVPALWLAELLAVALAHESGLFPAVLVAGGLATVSLSVAVAGLNAARRGGVIVGCALAASPIAGYTSFLALDPSYGLLTALGVAVGYGTLFGTIGHLLGVVARAVTKGS